MEQRQEPILQTPWHHDGRARGKLSQAFRPVTGLLLTVVLIVVSLPVAAQELSVANISRYVDNGRWDWTVFIRASPKLLERISCVEYRLHRSFPNPLRRVCQPGDPRYPFGLSTNGWGVFTIHILVMFRDGGSRPLTHMLTFEPPPTQGK